MPRIVVSGGTGFIGRRLVRRLVAEGNEVVVLTRRTAVDDVVVGASYATLDFSDPTHIARGRDLGSADTFFHLSSSIDATTELSARALSLLREEVLHPLRFLDTLGTSLRSVVFASTILVYPLVGALPFVEDRDENPAGFYGLRKLHFEDAGRLWATQTGARFASARIGQTYGPRMRVNRILPDTIAKARRGEDVLVFGDGSTLLDWVHVDDVVDGLLACRHHVPGGRFNLGTGVGVTNLELVHAVVRACGDRSQIRLVPERTVAPQRQVMDIGAARAALGYSPRHDFASGLTAMLEEGA